MGLALPKPLDTGAASSTSEFQLPHCSHLPIQRLNEEPQLWQTNFVVVLAINPHVTEQIAYAQLGGAPKFFPLGRFGDGGFISYTIDEEFAIEMVDFVLKDAGMKVIIELKHNAFA